jgi:ribosomal protein S5
MASRKRRAITVETHEVLIIRQRDSSIRAWCVECNAEVRMIPADEAMGLTGISMTAILDMASAGDVHSVQQGTCAPLICLKSLIARLAPRALESS